MAVRVIASCVLLITLLIAPTNCGPVFGAERPAGLPEGLTARVDGVFANCNRRDSRGSAVEIVHWQYPCPGHEENLHEP
jgi:hypothetical protein